MEYVSFMGLLNETNRPPGGKESMRLMAQNAFLTKDSKVLHAGCNTGYCTFELAHLTKCSVTAIDLNERMIASAQARLAKEPEEYRSKISFQIGDARTLPFPDDTFDLVMSGGSTAFIADRDAAVREYARVAKPYGYVGDVFLFYRTEPPQDLLDRLNALLGIGIKPWGADFWTSLYERAGLEIFYMHTAVMPKDPSDADVLAYCRTLVSSAGFSTEAVETAVEKLYGYMSLFAENHRYLGYAVLLCRKRPEPEQADLFGA